ncbi:MAG: T9SS type A sorting domain-containing protein [Flavobacterium sp. JAD_PAG50586_2]|nr:MAG: T9SS type A sorting domain-containing protein [Flavobacterium sp. JAD_PAG50586_2]
MKKITLLTGMFLSSLFSFAQAPSNDECTGAIALTVNADQLCGTVTAGTTFGGTPSAQDQSEVSGTPNNDVWYIFEATGVQHKISLTNIVDLNGDDESDMGLAVYSGDCAVLTFVATSDPESFNVTGLVAGTRYYVRVYGWYEDSNPMNFNICIGSPLVSAPPVNDECAGAIGLTVNSDQLCGTVTEGTTLGGTPSAQDPSEVSGTPNNDVWYTFVATAVQHKISLSNIEDLNGDGQSDMGLAVYSGNCAVLSFVDTSDPESFSVIGLVPGTTYYVRVYGWNSDSNPMSFDICIGTQLIASTPVNDECEGAITLTAGPNACVTPTPGTTAGGTPSAQDPSEVSGTPNNDVWYTFTAIETEHRVSVGNIINLNGESSTDMGIAVYSGSCNALAFVDTSDPESINVTGLVVGNQYYVRVYGWYENSGPMSFGICVSSQASVPDNDNCSGATVATLPYTNSQDASGATNDSGFIGCDGDEMNDGVWYTFIGNGSDIEITVNPFGWDPEIGIYKGNCSSFQCEGSVDNGGMGTPELYLLENSEQGVTYYVNVGYYGSSEDEPEGPFTIGITSPLGVPGFDTSLFRAYPNPVNDLLNLDYIQDISSVTVFNLLGQQMISKEINANKGTIDMSGIAAGSYLVKIIAGNQSKTIKVIKN